MQYRLKSEFKTILKGLLISLLIFLQSISVHADTGNLKINNQVIYEKNEDSQNNSATFTISQLFMEEMSEQNKQLDEEKTKQIINAQKEVFVKEIPTQYTITQEITPRLFAHGYTLKDSLNASSSGLKKANHSGFILLYVVGSFLIVGLGFGLGRTFPTWRKKG
ncbi:MAG: hypothetical protein IC227_04555 [Enterococcus lacertideformus]|uniref:Type VII secretion protein EssA n=1 Tax=Enterococcus lacertideformus TaxID=2771493 RepID=A0A931FBM8_9ENTE|nr:hypothetical protein [Enterococcus lacertideformus]